MNGIRKLMCSIACCFMIFSNAPVTILATETDEIMEETTVDEIENNTLEEETQNEIENSSEEKNVQEEQTEGEEEKSEDVDVDEDEQSLSAGASVASLMSTFSFPGSSGGKNDHDKPSGGTRYNHVDVRVDGTLTLISKVNDEVLSTETINITTSNVSGTLNGTSMRFYRKNGTGIENEWRASNLKLNPATDTVTINCTLTGRRSNNSIISVNYSNTYTGQSILNTFIQNCPAKNGYDININAQEISQSFTVNRTIQKVWELNGNQEIPSAVTVQLKANGKNYGNPIVLSANNNWTVQVKDLPKYSSGNTLINYTVVESNVDGFSPTYSYNGETITITNTAQETEKRSITVTKEWDDGNNQDGKRPAQVEVNLLKNGDKLDTIILNDENNWTYTFTNLEKFDGKDLIEYKVEEVTKNEDGKDLLDGYTNTVTGTMDSGFTITNKHTPETIEKIHVSKTWDDNNNQDEIRPDEIMVYLKSGDIVYKTAVLNEENNWSNVFTNVPKYSNGKEIEYTVEELKVDGYTSVITGDVASGFTVTNTQVYDSITVKKEWNDNNNHDGLRPEEVYIYLIGKVTTDDRVIFLAYDDQISLNDRNNWTYSYLDHPVYYEGHKIEYILHEGEVDNYTTEITGDAEKGFIVTNTEVKDITVQKVWKDNDDFYGKRPDEITVALFANGKEVSTIQVKESEDWTATFEDVPVYENGNKIKYEVYEKYTIDNDDYKYYDSYVEEDENGGFIITNIFNYFSFTIRKVWNDQNDKDGIRPEKVQFELYQNGELKDTFTLSERNDWDIDFTVHAFDDDGNVIEYSVVEINVANNYTSKVTGSALDDFTITNTHEITKKEDPKNEETKTNNTNTGVVSSFRSNILLLTLSAIGVFFFNKKRK